MLNLKPYNGAQTLTPISLLISNPIVNPIMVVVQAQGSAVSRAAANRNNPLHWFSGGHTHSYPHSRDDDDSAPATPSAAFTPSSDAGILSTESSLDDSALKGTPRSSVRASGEYSDPSSLALGMSIAVIFGYNDPLASNAGIASTARRQRHAL